MKNKFLIFFLTITTGVLLGISLKTKSSIISSPISSEVEDYRRELLSTREQIKVNNEILDDLRQRASEIDENLDQDELNSKLEEEISYLKKLSASTDVVGEGIIITLDDSKDKVLSGTNFGIIHDIDILNIINELKIYNAEAISINDIRLNGLSDIKCGGPIIRIDGKSSSIPFIIKAIGDKDILMTSASASNSYLSLLKDIYKVEIKIEESNSILIPKK
ncbi:MAG: DUF881 domain-containing protein [Ezakiella sp.]|nr:DUF881 domain-containing protein [Ezakiella sp.]MDY3946593.1 DUF881 domain-containing protein [Ezakiella sp.]